MGREGTCGILALLAWSCAQQAPTVPSASVDPDAARTLETMQGIVPIRWRDGEDRGLRAMGTPCEGPGACELAEAELALVERLLRGDCPQAPECPQMFVTAIDACLRIASIERWWEGGSGLAADRHNFNDDSDEVTAARVSAEGHRQRLSEVLDRAVQLGEQLVADYPDAGDNAAGWAVLAMALAERIGEAVDPERRRADVGRLAEICREIIARESSYGVFAYALLAEHALWESSNPDAALADADAGLALMTGGTNDGSGATGLRALLEYARACALRWLGRSDAALAAFRSCRVLAANLHTFYPPIGLDGAVEQAIDVVLGEGADEAAP